MTAPPEIQRLLDVWLKRLREGDAAGCADLYTDDGAIYSFAEPFQARGRDEIETMHRAWLNAGEINQQLTVMEAGAEDVLGYCIAEWKGDFPQENGGYETISGKVLTVLRRKGVGPWRFHISSLTTDPPHTSS